jgi:uncharacterized Ntn-hydrolase superfamily protein
MTFSISAHCRETGMFGIAISSSSPAVAARCAHARAGVGVVASQNITDPALGHLGLDLLGRGEGARSVLQALIASTPHADYRQLAIVDRNGETAAFSGRHTLGVHATAEGPGAVAAGNLLANDRVPQTMIEAYAGNGGPLAARLLAAMEAGLATGGEAGPVRSAGLLMVRDVTWPVADLRVDWHDRPIEALRNLWQIYEPQLEDYVRRAFDPGTAPKFGVPGDE